MIGHSRGAKRNNISHHDRAEAAEVLGEALSGMEAIIAQGLLRPIRARPGQRRPATDEVYAALLALHGHRRQDDRQ
jgi:hypothetical protein